MSFADNERVRIRMHAGYPARGVLPADDALDVAMDGLSPDEEDLILHTFLPRLDGLEAAIGATSETLDTDRAAVWFRNKNEVFEREWLYYRQRVFLCGFLGVPTGPFLLPPVVATPADTVTGAGAGLIPAVYVV